MAVSNLVAASSGLTTTRFPAAIGNPFHIPAGLTLQNTITSSTSFAAGTFPSQIWVVLIGAGGGGSNGGTSTIGAGGGGGGACIGWMDVPSSGTIYAVIGSGGTGGNGGSNSTAGAAGGNTTFGSLIAYGGGPGYGGNLVSSTAFNNIIFPKGPGAGTGGTSAGALAANSFSPIVFISNSAPWTNNGKQLTTFQNFSTSSSASLPTYSLSEWSNFTGGGGGYASYNQNGGDGLTGGGNAGSTGSSWRGGNSSRDGGSTFTFTGSTTTNVNGAAGAGFLANGSGSTGGSGGGGGAGQYSTNTGGTGGNGCILIYY